MRTDALHKFVCCVCSVICIWHIQVIFNFNPREFTLVTSPILWNFVFSGCPNAVTWEHQDVYSMADIVWFLVTILAVPQTTSCNGFPYSQSLSDMCNCLLNRLFFCNSLCCSSWLARWFGCKALSASSCLLRSLQLTGTSSLGLVPYTTEKISNCNLEQTHREAGKQGSTTAQMETNKVAPVYRYVMSNSNNYIICRFRFTYVEMHRHRLWQCMDVRGCTDRQSHIAVNYLWHIDIWWCIHTHSAMQIMACKKQEFFEKTHPDFILHIHTGL